jgi:hypothetical protein
MHNSLPLFSIPIMTMASPTTYTPNLLAAELEYDDDLIKIRDHLQGKDWLTNGLVDEITVSFPNSNDIDPMTGARDQTRFSENCLKLFPQDRIFASEKQIEQVASMFLDAWSVVKAHNGKKIICHYGLNTKKFPPPINVSMPPGRQRCNAPSGSPILTRA